MADFRGSFIPILYVLLYYLNVRTLTT